MAFQDMELNLQSLQGLVMIEGKNHDDGGHGSGSGKTSILDMISFGMFGEVPRNIGINEFVNDSAGKGCEVKLELLTDNNKKLTICRTRKPDDLWYQIEDGAVIRSDNIRKTQSTLEEMLKLNFNTFVNSVYFTQNAKSKFISASDTEKRDVLTRILDLSDFDKAYEVASLKSKELTQSLGEINNQIAIENSKRTYIERDIENLNKQSANFETQKQEEIKQLQRTIGQLENDILSIDTKIKQIEEITYQVIPTSSIPKPVLEPLEKEQKLLQNKEYPDIAEIDPLDISDLEVKIAELKGKLKTKELLVKKERELLVDKAILDQDIATRMVEISSLDGKSSGTCSHCLQPIDLSLIETHIQREKALLKTWHTKLEDIVNNLTKIDTALNNLKKYEKELADTETQIKLREKEHLLKSQQYLKQKEDVQKQQLADAQQIQKLEQHKSHLIEKYNQKVAEVQKKNAEIDTLVIKDIAQKQSLNETKSLKQLQITQVYISIEKLKSKLNPYQDTIQVKEGEILVSNDVLASYNALKEELNQKIETYEILKTSYKNIKYYIFESTIDELNNRVSKYIDPLFNEDVKIEYKYLNGKDSDKLKFATTITKNGIEKTYESLSDGEKKRAELATNFALADIVAMRKSNSLSLMILDECFGGLPAECIERVVSLLETLVTEKQLVLMIDHVQATKDLVSETIKVEKRAGISTLLLDS
jgi:DNA repair exonuclease SbcCD ATPase subunit